MKVSDYFKVVSEEGRVLHLAMKGFWSDRVIEELDSVFRSLFNEAVDRVSSDGPFLILADLTNLSVLTKEGRAAFATSMAYARKHGLYKAVEVIPNPITALSVAEAAERTGNDDFRTVVKSPEEAHRVIDDLKRELSPVMETGGCSC